VKTKSPLSHSRAAFTLVEMMAAMIVLALLLLMVSQLVNQTAKVTSSARRSMDAAIQARMVFDRMASDFARMPKRPDLDYKFTKDAGNDSMIFYSETAGFFPSATAVNQSTVSLVGYRVNTSYQLERAGVGKTWDASTPDAVKFLTYTIGNPTATDGTLTPPPDTNYQVTGNQVFRMEFCYLLKPDTTVPPSAKSAKYSNTPYLASTPADPTNPVNGFKDVSAIVVTIGVLDDRSRTIVPKSALGALAAALPDPAENDLNAATPILPLQSWQAVIDKPDFYTTVGIPQAAAQQVRVFQRFFYLNNR
jgi:prepilin-type N-terminal cleavage/methylation domain-containing protein